MQQQSAMMQSSGAPHFGGDDYKMHLPNFMNESHNNQRGNPLADNQHFSQEFSMNTPNMELFKDSMNQRSLNSLDEIKREGINHSKGEFKERNKS